MLVLKLLHEKFALSSNSTLIASHETRFEIRSRSLRNRRSRVNQWLNQLNHWLLFRLHCHRLFLRLHWSSNWNRFLCLGLRICWLLSFINCYGRLLRSSQWHIMEWYPTVIINVVRDLLLRLHDMLKNVFIIRVIMVMVHFVWRNNCWLDGVSCLRNLSLFIFHCYI